MKRTRPDAHAFGVGRPIVGTSDEPIFYYALDGQYSGRLPAFYEPSTVDAVSNLEVAFGEIQAEVRAVAELHPELFSINFTPEGYRNSGWQTINLYTDGLRYHRNCSWLPRTTAVCESLDGFSSAQVGILGPGAEVPPHHGDTNVMYRLHLALGVPAPHPEVGIRVASEESGWEEGRVLVFEDAHLHSVWNRSEYPRTVLVVDVIKDELRGRLRSLQAMAGAGILLQFAQSRVPVLEKAPSWVRQGLLGLAAPAIRAALPLQRSMFRRSSAHGLMKGAAPGSDPS